MANGHELQRSVNQLYPLEVTAKEDPKPYDKPKPTRIQPPRAAKRVRFALGMYRATISHQLRFHPPLTSHEELPSPSQSTTFQDRTTSSIHDPLTRDGTETPDPPRLLA
ncbi:hypothetical protein Y032_0326g2581 [Ancylostoma ceylanicum]|uniref:Uncharacterized protein n=1 Tax=Ancylostoma ceylanicum TaxID=53326 RepID=A0A016S0D3_9BILA|nr:hypothetical protein Y032_0326g2581 [Ancylostoma ceylanicum]